MLADPVSPCTAMLRLGYSRRIAAMPAMVSRLARLVSSSVCAIDHACEMSGSSSSPAPLKWTPCVCMYDEIRAYASLA